MLATTLAQLQLVGPDPVVTQLTNTPIFLAVVKALFVIGALMYAIFSFVVVRQITLMRKTVITSLASFLQLVGYIHLIAAILVVLLFLAIL